MERLNQEAEIQKQRKLQMQMQRREAESAGQQPDFSFPSYSNQPSQEIVKSKSMMENNDGQSDRIFSHDEIAMQPITQRAQEELKSKRAIGLTIKTP